MEKELDLKPIKGMKGYFLNNNGLVVSPCGNILKKSKTGQIKCKIKGRCTTMSLNKIRFSVEHDLDVWDIPSNVYFVEEEGIIKPMTVSDVLNRKRCEKKCTGVRRENIEMHYQWVKTIYEYANGIDDGHGIAVFLEKHRIGFIKMIRTKMKLSYEYSAELVDESVLNILDNVTNGVYCTNVLFEIYNLCRKMLEKKNKQRRYEEGGLIERRIRGVRKDV